MNENRKNVMPFVIAFLAGVAVAAIVAFVMFGRSRMHSRRRRQRQMRRRRRRLSRRRIHRKRLKRNLIRRKPPHPVKTSTML